MAVAPSLPPELASGPRLAAVAEPQRSSWAASPLPRFSLNGIPIDRVSLDEAAAWALRTIKTKALGRPLLIMGPNAQLVTLAARKPKFAKALRSADLSVPDGISVVLAARLLGQPVPERVPGGELMERLCLESAQHGLSVFFLGGLPGAAEGAARRFTSRSPGFRLAGTYCPPVGFENDPFECARIRRRITEAKPDLLCVAFGAPRQELWMRETCPTLPIGAAISVGAALDTQAGLRKRAPKWTHRIGCEWLYRMLREPRRLWRRYLIGNTHFLLLVAQEWWRRASTASSGPQPVSRRKGANHARN
jgi:N-acetylglucosaminyldiphosphoundecaprenol N-acetyl-beta-D-mannosaminyltransferase